jgi:hypothetical protein
MGESVGEHQKSGIVMKFGQPHDVHMGALIKV